MKVEFSSDIQKDFCEGVNEIFEELFDKTVYFYGLNEENSKINVYNEATSRYYNEPIDFLAHPLLNVAQEDEYNKTSKYNSSFIVPMYQFLVKGLPTTKEAFEQMKKGAVRYKDITYQIDEIAPTTNVKDMFLFVKITCSEPSTPLVLRSLTGEMF